MTDALLTEPALADRRTASAEHPAGAVQDSIRREQANRRLVRTWLYLVCLLILAMVIVGGATRLTDSGLSITEWKPVTGVIPPLSEADWQAELEKYRQIPEYQQINKGMSLDEFKFIYWWEWGHRLLGRIIGFAVAIPLAFFWLTGRLEQRLKPRLVGLFILGGMQGVIGWWMVTSGLVDRVDVSQYRLAVHLTLAAIIFAWTLWIARGLAPHTTHLAPPPILSRLAVVTTLLIVLQIFMGGLVAGLDAGFAFNDWPLMDGAVIPGGLAVLDPVWINWFENPKSVQFNHRMMGYFVLAAIFLQMVLVLASKAEAPHKRRTVIIFLLAVTQAIIGIVTLMLQVPMSWALLHQGGAIVLLGAAIAHWRGLKGPYAPITSLEVRG